MNDSIMSAKATIFPCPNCGQMIYSDAETCRFCSATIDRQMAASGAALQRQINDACNHAKMIRNMAGVMWIFLLLGLVLGVFNWGHYGLFFLIPFYVGYWYLNYGSIKTTDVDYKTAKRDIFISLLFWLPALVLRVVLFALTITLKS